MPFSHSSQLSPILGYLEKLQPTSILDVGTGMGQYGFLARTNLENTHLFHVKGQKGEQRAKSEWNILIDGIEGCEIYQTPVHDYAYDNMYWGDAMKILSTISKRYELVLAIDILEHFNKDEGYDFIEQLKRVSQNVVLISTPKFFTEQEVEANPYENHRSFWDSNELIACGFTQFLDNSSSWLAVHQKNG